MIMIRKRSTAALFAVCIIGNGIACGSDNVFSNSITASAETIDSGTFGESFNWELDDAGILIDAAIKS